MARIRQRLQRTSQSEAGSEEPDAAIPRRDEADTSVGGSEDATLVVSSELAPTAADHAGADEPAVKVDVDAVELRNVASLRRDRAVLIDRYAEASADLGGLVIEMARRQDFRLTLLEQRAAAAAALEDEIASIDGRIAALRDRGRALPGRTVPTPERACGQCGGLIVAEANFCAYCGAAQSADA